MATRRSAFISGAGVFLTAAALVGAAILYLAGKKFGIRLAFDPHDLNIYFTSLSG